MDSEGKSAQKVVFGKLSPETVTMAPLGLKMSRLMSVWDGASHALRDLLWHRQVSGARLRDFNGGLQSKKHGGSVCVFSEASIYYLRGHKCKFTGLLYPWEWRKNRDYGFFFSPWSRRLATWKLIHWHMYTLTNSHFTVKSPWRMILLFFQFSAIKGLSHQMRNKSQMNNTAKTLTHIPLNLNYITF